MKVCAGRFTRESRDSPSPSLWDTQHRHVGHGVMDLWVPETACQMAAPTTHTESEKWALRNELEAGDGPLTSLELQRTV